MARRPLMLRLAFGAALIGTLAACASMPRQSFTQEEQRVAVIPGVPRARSWSDDPSALRTLAMPASNRAPVLLALSGGGADGAFGAGLLNGWSAKGTRPEFTVVTGVSAGALIAPLAFLGPRYDHVLEALFTNGEAAGLLQSDYLSGLFGTGLFKAEPLQNLVAKYVDDELLRAVAREHLKGRRLLVATTNVDAQRTAIWDLGAIAASGHPQARTLFRNVLIASASIPGIYSPVLIEVEAGARRFAEMHVDGGVTANVLIVPEAFLLSGATLPARSQKPTIYVVLNGKLTPELEIVQAATVPIITRSFQTTVKANMRNSLIATYEYARQQGWNFNIASIDDGYPSQTSLGFDTAYMRALFSHGYEVGRGPAAWRNAVPNVLAGQTPARR